MAGVNLRLPALLPWHHQSWQRAGLASGVAQSVLVSGAAGAGLREFGWAVLLRSLCQTPSADGQACGRCQDCDWAGQGRHPDMLVLGVDAPDHEEAGDEAAPATEERKRDRSHIGVADIRGLTVFLQKSPTRDHARTALLWPADSMNLAAANALLKILEEPPARTHLVLVARSLERLPATIRSRCRLLRLQGPSAQEARAWVRAQQVDQPELALAQVGQAPLAAAELPAAFWTARERLLPGLAAVGGRARQGRLLDVAEAVELPHLVHLLQTWCLDLMAARHAIAPRYHPDHADALRRCAPNAGGEALFALARQLGHSRRLLEHPLNPRLAAEELLLAYMAVFDRG
jgi:DNA polymerase-3 subunit delta'